MSVPNPKIMTASSDVAAEPFIQRTPNEKSPSIQYSSYLRKQRNRNLSIRLAQWLVLFVFLGVWELAANMSWIDTMLTSKPSQIFASFKELLIKGEILHHTWITTKETILGFIVSMVIGTLLAILLWSSRFLSEVVEPYIVVLNALPKVALGPIFYIWLGDQLSIYGMAIAISIIVTVIMVHSGFQEISKGKMKLMESFGATRWQMLKMVVLPASIPNFVATMKVNVGLTLVGVIMGEFLSSKAGLGFLITYGGQVFQMNLVMTSITILAILSVVMYWLVNMAGKKLQKIYHFD
ncbi:ABC transporter permease [Bacillus sp. X1(2014)]|uniref:ABC transporter permease n=1 Tax=Bacillus sp. X1(2014) TaxID=1565991 RepID=UPI0021B34C1D|nr:ABC transporter permease [Bacillus sp. X1(2014)]